MSLEAIICKGSNCSPVKLLGLKREHVLGGEKSAYFRLFVDLGETKLCKAVSTSAGAVRELVRRWASRGISRCVLFQNDCEKNWTYYLEMPCQNSPNGFHKKNGRYNIC